CEEVYAVESPWTTARDRAVARQAGSSLRRSRSHARLLGSRGLGSGEARRDLLGEEAVDLLGSAADERRGIEQRIEPIAQHRERRVGAEPLEQRVLAALDLHEPRRLPGVHTDPLVRFLAIRS